MGSRTGWKAFCCSPFTAYLASRSTRYPRDRLHPTTMFRIRPLLAVMLFASLLGAQVKDGSPVTFLATVTDSRGRAIGDLRQQDFELREDGKDVKVASFATFRKIPSSVGVLLDVSGSMRPKLAKAT